MEGGKLAFDGATRVKVRSTSVLVLSALLFAAALRPASAAHPAFPADNDTLAYEIRGQDYVTYNNGSRFSYPIEIDLSHKIVNHTGDRYFANISLTFRKPPILLQLNLTGVLNWTVLVHYYADSGEIRRLYTANRLNWSELSGAFMSDLLFIPQQTVPGETVYWIWPQAESEEWTEFGVPVDLGPIYTVGSMGLSTVRMLLNARYQYNGTVTTSTDVLSSQFFADGYWEWSLGFLTKLSFDYTKTINPNCLPNHNATQLWFVGTCSLVSYALADTPIPYVPTTSTTPPIPGFSPASILLGLLVALVSLSIFRKRRH